MRNCHSVMLAFLMLALMAVAEELVVNPRFEDGLKGWTNWGKKMGTTLTVTPEGLLIKAIGPKLNQGAAQTVKLKPGYEYEYSCKLKGKLEANSRASVLSWYYPQDKKGRNLRLLRGDFDWWTHMVSFTVPSTSDGIVLLRPVSLTGPGEITIEWVSLKEKGEGVEAQKEKERHIPEVVPVVHPEKRIDLSREQPANVRMHINEKVSQPIEGNSVTNKDGAFVINYSFPSNGHDAVLFDLVKNIDSCKKLSMDITSDDKGHQLYFVLIDKSGEAHLTEKPLKLDFNGEKKFKMLIPLPAEKPYNILDSIWGGDGNQHLDLPLKSLTIVLDDSPDASTDTGVITIKNLTIGNW